MRFSVSKALGGMYLKRLSSCSTLFNLFNLITKKKLTEIENILVEKRRLKETKLHNL